MQYSSITIGNEVKERQLKWKVNQYDASCTFEWKLRQLLSNPERYRMFNFWSVMCCSEVKRLWVLMFQNSRRGCIPTNIFDHFEYAKEYLKSGIPVYAPQKKTHGTLSKEYDAQKIVRCGYEYSIGNFKIYPFHAEHDVVCFDT